MAPSDDNRLADDEILGPIIDPRDRLPADVLARAHEKLEALAQLPHTLSPDEYLREAIRLLEIDPEHAQHLDPESLAQLCRLLVP